MRLLLPAVCTFANILTHRDPAVKRTLCKGKGCGAVLVPGLTATVRIKRALLIPFLPPYTRTDVSLEPTASGPHAHLIMTTCLGCRHQFRLPAPPHLRPVDPDPAPDEMAVDLPARERRDGGKRERRDQRRARRPTFFQRTGHTTFAGATKVERQD